MTNKSRIGITFGHEFDTPLSEITGSLTFSKSSASN